jgi:hypothetical protein
MRPNLWKSECPEQLPCHNQIRLLFSNLLEVNMKTMGDA